MGFSQSDFGQNRRKGFNRSFYWIFLILVALQIPFASLSEAQTLSPSGITFTASAGGGAPQNQTLSLNPVASLGIQTVTVSKKANWLNVTPTNDTIWEYVHYFVASVNTSGLSAGLYTDTIQLTMVAPNGSVRTTSTLVTLNLTNGSASPKIALSSGALTFSGLAGGSVPSTQTLTISNPGGGTLNYNIGSSAPWLLVTPASGSMTTGIGTITVTANTSGLGAGSYSGLLTFSGNGSNAPQQVIVNLTVSSQSGTPSLAVSPASATISVPQGTKGPVVFPITIFNAGGSQAIDWTSADTADWLQRAYAGTTPAVNELWYWPDGLGVGTYTAAVTVTGAGVTKVIPVSMTITPAGTAASSTSAAAPTPPPTSTPTLAVSPPSVSVAYPVGSRGPMIYNLNIANIGGGGARQWTASDTASWIWRAESGTTPAPLELWLFPDGLAAGTYTAQVSVNMPGATNSTMTIPVTMTVGGSAAAAAPAQTTSVTLSWNSNSESDMSGYKVYYGTTSKSYTSSVNAGNVTSYTLSGLATGKTYYFAISALDQTGNESGKSGEASVTR